MSSLFYFNQKRFAILGWFNHFRATKCVFGYKYSIFLTFSQFPLIFLLVRH